MPKFSILIPTIGRHDLVRTAIESLSKQTCQDFEVIVGDSHRNKDIINHVVDHRESEKILHHEPTAQRRSRVGRAP